MLADAAFDAEAHYRFAREGLGVRSSVIPINARGHDAAPNGKYRGQMVRRFRAKPGGRRSRHKRRRGSAVCGRSDDSRKRERYLRVLTHNLMLLAAAG